MTNTEKMDHLPYGATGLHLVNCFGGYRPSCKKCGGALKDMTAINKTCMECGYKSTGFSLVSLEEIITPHDMQFAEACMVALQGEFTEVIKTITPSGVILRRKGRTAGGLTWIPRRTHKSLIPSMFWIYVRSNEGMPRDLFYSVLATFYKKDDTRDKKYISYNTKGKPPENKQKEKEIVSVLCQRYYEYGKLLVAGSFLESEIENIEKALEYGVPNNVIEYIRDEKRIDYKRIEPYIDSIGSKYKRDVDVVWHGKKHIIFN